MSPPVVPAREPENGEQLLEDVQAFLARFVAFPSEHALVAATLWAAHTHGVDYFESSPRLAPLSPEPGSGKTRLLECLEVLTPRPMFTVNASSAALFRKVSDPNGKPTVLLDEADTVFGPRAAKEHEDLRGFVNAGHRKGATAIRCVVRGKTVDVEEYEAYAAVAVAGLDDLPDTIMSRSVVIRMRRRAPDELIEPFRRRIHAPQGAVLSDRLAAWVHDSRPRLDGAWPEMPEGVTDRAADVWEPLLAIADAAGGDWPKRARVTAVTLVTAAMGSRESLGIRLLADLQTVFADHDVMSTEQILSELNAMTESPWGDLKGKPLDPRGLARRLAKYQVTRTTVRLDSGHVAKGYKRADLHDVWRRYVPEAAPPGVCQNTDKEDLTDTLPLSHMAPVTSVTSVTDHLTTLPGRCPSCGRHIETQGHRNDCEAAA